MKSDTEHQKSGRELDEADQEFFSYLDTLLAEIDGSFPVASKLQTKVTTPQAATDCQEQSILLEAVEQASDTGSTQGNVQLLASDSGDIPHWARAPFQVLFFDVCGMTLGVPLVSLTGIMKKHEAFSRMPGQPVWHLGVVPHRQRNVVVVDTSRLIMPERIGPAREALAISGTHLLLIGKGDFGLLIDSIKDTVSMDVRQIRWRSNPVKNTWLAGIIIERLSALLNVDALLGMLQEA